MDLVESLTAKARRIQRDDPAYWDSIPDGPIPPEGLIAQICWALKRYDLDDPALRDLPYTERVRLSRAETR